MPSWSLPQAERAPAFWSSLPCSPITLARDRWRGNMTPTGKQKKKKGKATGMWRNLVALTFSVFLLGAALMANVGDGPMSQYRGSWLTRASR